MLCAGRSLALALWLLGGAAMPAHAFPRFAQGWQDLSPGERYEALRNYERHRDQSEKRQRSIERRYERWQQMPEQERERIRKNYDRYQKLPPSERREYDNRYKSWKKDSKRG